MHAWLAAAGGFLLAALWMDLIKVPVGTCKPPPYSSPPPPSVDANSPM